MLRWLAPRLPPRSPRSNYIQVGLDSGSSQVLLDTRLVPGIDKSSLIATPIDHILTRSLPPYLVTNHLPPAPSPPSDPHTPNSSLCPPFHIHLKEDETFHVISGTAKFLLLDQRRRPADTAASITQDGITTRPATPGTTVTIPRGQIHTFRNASTTQPLEIEFGFSPPTPSSDPSQPTSAEGLRHGSTTAKLNAKMHRFFLNTQLYRSDCTAHNVPRSLAQVLLFNHSADVALVPGWLLSLHTRFPPLRGVIEQAIAPTIGRLMNVLGGLLIGKHVFGLKASYPEYYPYDATSTRIPASANSAAVVKHSDKCRG